MAKRIIPRYLDYNIQSKDTRVYHTWAVIFNFGTVCDTSWKSTTWEICSIGSLCIGKIANFFLVWDLGTI